MTLSGTMSLSYWMYSKLPNPNDFLTSHQVSPSEFILLPLSRFVEPDPLPWFKCISTGKVLTLMWSLFTMILIFAYQCDLRSTLIRPSFDQPIDTLEDALERGTNIYVLNALWDTLFLGDIKSESLRKVLERITANDGIYGLKYPTLPPAVAEDVKANGAIFILTKSTVSYFHFFDKVSGQGKTFSSY